MASLSIVLAMLATASSPAHHQPACTTLRVMTYNIRLDLESDGANKWSKRRDQFVGQIGLMHPAILGLQEVVRGQQADLEKAFPTYTFLGLPREGGPMGESANLAFDQTVFKVTKSGTFWLSPTPEVPSKGWDAAYRRIATWAHLVRRSDGRRFLALNTHLDNEGSTARLEGAREILGWLAAHKAPGEYVLMTGDLNSEPKSPPYAALTSSPLGLRDSRAISQSPPIGPEGTFNDFNPLPSNSQRIDYVLVGSGVSVLRYAVLSWHGEGGRTASDHFPVVADLAACGAAG